MGRENDFFERVRFKGEPVANPDSIVTFGQARFTVLTDRLVRMEWSETGEFQDGATYAFPGRYAPAPRFTHRISGDRLEIDTGALQIRYRRTEAPFDSRNLAITFELDGQRQRWVPGQPDRLNLGGTRRTLDGCAAEATLERGLLSRDGWVLYDDSQAVIFDQDGWVAPRPSHHQQDWYFFGYGRAYKEALQAYTRFGGKPPLIPRFVLGAWWSRYWAYTDEALKELVQTFEEHDLPLDVLVIDMDWHTTDSWTGYTWNRDLFPDPEGFLRWVHDRGLHTTLNLHPAEGVQHFEEQYEAFAEVFDIEPESCEPVPFQITNKTFARHYFELLHHPLEEQGVDFWWMDWQQGRTCELEGLDPLPWLNHLHYRDSTRHNRRGMLYSRWGGLGNHRYPIGFSGDTLAVWRALQFQPHFTASASNVLFGWWSHDIGGHFGATEPELFARWVQYGALSPCLRLHSNNDPKAERRPWAFPEETLHAARAAFHLRYQLIPYLYTMARVMTDTGLSLCRPMYYDYPADEDAYVARDQYFLGDQIIAAPILRPADPASGLATTDVWVPEGQWIEYTTKEHFTGPRWIRLAGDLDRVPMLVRAGAIIPLAPVAKNTQAIPTDRLILSIFPGEEGAFRFYEDDGISENYWHGDVEWTEITMRYEGPERCVVQLAPTEGTCDDLPASRRYEVRLEGTHRPSRVLLNGEGHEDWTYDANERRTTIRTPLQPKKQPLDITAVGEGALSALDGTHNRAVRQQDLERYLGQPVPDGTFAEVADRILDRVSGSQWSALARWGGPFVKWLAFVTPEEASRNLGAVVVAAPADGSPVDIELRWRLLGQEHVERLEGVTSAQVLYSPFAFDGEPRTMRWEAEVKLHWRGTTLEDHFRSRTLFPAIHRWRALVYNEEEAPVALDQVLGARGAVDDTLAWEPFEQDPYHVDFQNLTLPYRLPFVRRGKIWFPPRQPHAAYATTTIHSPDEREVVLTYLPLGSMTFYVNGEAVAGGLEVPAGSEAVTALRDAVPLDLHPLRTEPVRLKAGANRLLVATRPPEDMRWHYWSLVVLVEGPDGTLQTDLSFDR